MKDFSLITSFFNQNKYTAMVDFHRKMATSIEAVIECFFQLEQNTRQV